MKIIATVILFIIWGFNFSDFPREWTNTISENHKKICSEQVYLVVDSTFVKSLNADGIENKQGLYVVVTKWKSDFAQSVALLGGYNKKTYDHYNLIFDDSILINKKSSYIQKIHLPEYNHVVFQLIISKGKESLYIKAGSPAEMQLFLEDILKTLAINY